MTVLIAVFLGMVQGLTEFLPISSSAHLFLLPWFFGFRDPGLVFDVALHLGTLAAVLVYFRRDWYELVKSGFGQGGQTRPKTFWLIVLGAVPGGLAGILLEDAANAAFRSPAIVTAALASAGLLLLVADMKGKTIRRTDDLTVRHALALGLAQACALVPGVSRSGATITAARALGYSREESARLSFLLAAPIVAGAALWSLRHLTVVDLSPGFFAGIVAAAATGLVVIRFLLAYVSKKSYRPFVWYRFALAAVVVVVSLIRG